MARPIKEWLSYFSMDVEKDKKLKMLKVKHGVFGFWLYIELLQFIYKESYYIERDDDTQLLFLSETNVDPEKLEEIMDFMFLKNLFDKEIFEKYNVLTSTWIQKRYAEWTKKRNKFHVNYNYWIGWNFEHIELSELKGEKTLVKGELTTADEELSELKGEKTLVKGELSTQRKGKESKEKQTKGNNPISEKSETSLRSDEDHNSFNPQKNENPPEEKKYWNENINFVIRCISENWPWVISDTLNEQRIYAKHIADKLFKAYWISWKEIFENAVQKISGDKYVWHYLWSIQDTYRNIGKILSKAVSQREITYPIEMDIQSLTLLDKQDKDVCLEVVSALHAKKSKGVSFIKYVDIKYIIDTILENGKNMKKWTWHTQSEPYNWSNLQKAKEDLIKKSSM